MTPTEVLTLIRNQVFEQTAAFYNDPEVYSYMTLAENEMSRKTDMAESTDTSITTVASTREYTKPSTITKLIRVTWNTVKLKKIDFTQLDQVEGVSYGFTGSTGSPVYYYEWAGKIGLSPIPTSAETLKLWCIVEPTALTSSSSSFTIGNEYGHYLADYAIYRMYLKDQDQSRADIHLGLWNNNKRLAEDDWVARKGDDKYKVVKQEDNFPGTFIGIS